MTGHDEKLDVFRDRSKLFGKRMKQHCNKSVRAGPGFLLANGMFPGIIQEIREKKHPKLELL